MKRWIAISVLLLLGCATKKPLNFRFSGCKVQHAWVDEKGNERRDCDCTHGRIVGWDAKTKLEIIRCE